MSVPLSAPCVGKIQKTKQSIRTNILQSKPVPYFLIHIPTTSNHLYSLFFIVHFHNKKMSMTPEQMAAAMLELDLDSSDEDEEETTTNNPPAPIAPPIQGGPGETKTGLKTVSVDTNFFAYKVDAKGDPTSEKFDMQKDFFNQPGNGDIQNAPDNLACKKSPQITANMLGALKDRDYTHVSRTQFQTLPMILKHFDPNKPHDQQTTGDHCVVQGPAGTGKTMAFIVGSVAQIDPNLKKPQVIVISNTVDLAEPRGAKIDVLGPAMPSKHSLSSPVHNSACHSNIWLAGFLPIAIQKS